MNPAPSRVADIGVSAVDSVLLSQFDNVRCAYRIADGVPVELSFSVAIGIHCLRLADLLHAYVQSGPVGDVVRVVFAGRNVIGSGRHLSV